jgi:hypothetical protein
VWVTLNHEQLDKGKKGKIYHHHSVQGYEITNKHNNVCLCLNQYPPVF